MKRSVVVMIMLLYSVVCSIPVLGSPTFCASKNSDVYHVSSCSYVDRIKSSNIIYFDSAEEAEASGRRGCSRCHPEQYKGAAESSSQSSSGSSGSTYDNSYGGDDSPIYPYPMFMSSESGELYHTTSCNKTRYIDSSKLKLYYSAEKAEKEGKQPCSECHPERYLRSYYKTLDLSTDDKLGIIAATPFDTSKGRIASGVGYEGGFNDGYNSRDAKARVEVERAYSSGYQSGSAAADDAWESGYAEGLLDGQEELETSNQEKYDSGYQVGYVDGAESEKVGPGGYILTGLSCLVCGAAGATLFVKKEEFTEWVRQ